MLTFRHAARLVLLLCLTQAPKGWAVDTLQLSIGDLTYDEIVIHQARVGLSLKHKSPSLTLQAASLTLPKPLHTLKAVNIQCGYWQMSEGMVCRAGRLQLSHPVLGRQKIRFELSLDQHQQGRLKLRDIQLASGRLDLVIQLQSSQHKVTAHIKDMQAEALLALADHFDLQRPDISVEGQLNGKINASIKNQKPTAIHAQLTLKQANWSDAEGLWVGEGVDLGVLVSQTLSQQQWCGETLFQAQHGGVLLENTYLDLSNALKLSHQGCVEPGVALKTESMALNWNKVIRAQAALAMQWEQEAPVLSSLDLTIPMLDVHAE